MVAVNGLTQAYLSVEGSASAENISAAMLLRKGPGRVARVSVTTAGTTVGSVHDAASTTLTAASVLLATIPNTVGVTIINMPVENGLVITPGTGQVLSVSYS